MDILVLRLSSLGDVVLSSAFTQSAAALWPHARITYVVRADLAEIAAMLPGVTRITAVARDAGAAGLMQLAAGLRRTRWAHVFDLHQSARSRFLCAAIGRRPVPGFDKQEWPRWMLLHARRDLYARSGGARALRLRMLEPLRRLGLEPPVQSTRLEFPSAARERAARVVEGGGLSASTLIALAPGARWAPKRWPESRFAALAARLTEAPDRALVVTGGPDERALCERVAASAAPGKSVVVAGTLDLGATAAVLERCAVAVTNDSGLLHIAEAAGRPVVALFGPTSPQFGYAPWRPQSVLLRQPPPCSPCSKNGQRPCTRPTHECMENLSVERVAAAVEQVLDPGRGGEPGVVHGAAHI